MYCKNCGSMIDDNTNVCPKCGATQNNNVSETNDNGGFLWGLLGCCVPIAGLILFLVWKDTKPKTAKAAGIGALVSVIIGVIWYVFVFVLSIGIGISGY
ncbi:zinc ribbon domain-containing protein [Tyzzerella sp. An114]|uniref:zinc-ribbon domain-containing protein n=1 Tax=Tyzzerella sp. An114 TaxID=1965545 RepID=UPI000B44A741|nr:zinc ribbon domain-containing protein [Tyzzerella sp. An114]OUQ59258.1 zinc ribbon domain-containing protein [Tyzzerella sp. An114]